MRKNVLSGIVFVYNLLFQLQLKNISFINNFEFTNQRIYNLKQLVFIYMVIIHGDLSVIIGIFFNRI